MNSIIFLSIALSFSLTQVGNCQSVAGKTDCYIQVEEVKRHFIVYQPATTHNKPLPVVFMFHGTSGNGEKFYNISGWKEKADKEGLIAVFPSALRYCVEEDSVTKNTTKWNDGKLEIVACKGQILKDDVFFFREMVNYLKKNYPVDVNRIYASGFSNGANFVSRLTLEASDILAATTMMAGFLQDTSFQAKSLISSYLAIGDLNVLKSAGVMPSWGENALELAVLRERVMLMVDELKLGRTAHFIEEEKIITWLFNQNKSNSNNEFRFSLIKDLDHKYPNGKNYPMVIADLFWDFFKRFHK